MHKLFRLFPSIAISASILLFVACLFGDGYYIAGPDPRGLSPGLALLLLGWFGVFYGVFTWLANPALALAWVLFFCKKPWLSLVAAYIALALMLGFLFQTTIVTSEAPTHSRIVGHGVGFWLWVASAGIQSIGSVVATYRSEFATTGNESA
jgi:hypothetical protein